MFSLLCYFHILLRCEDKKATQTVKEQYFKSTLGHFGVFVVKLHPLLDDTADSRVRVVDELEASDVGTTFPQVCQVNVQETLRQAGDRQRCALRYQEEKWVVSVQEANCQTVKKQDLHNSYYTALFPWSLSANHLYLSS